MGVFEQVAVWLAAAKTAVAFTGAGISTESGIPDFRSPGGVWATSTPVYYDEFLASESARYEYWRQKAQSHDDFVNSQPNAGHRALAQWEQQGRLSRVITQNIDGLHQDAGSANVIELHGTARFVSCLECGARFDADPLVREFLETDVPPCCGKCQGITKHATISFGQQLAPQVLEEAWQLSVDADVYLAMGSSLVVEPAASLPRNAKSHGARLVIINRDPTPLDHLADAVINESIGGALTSIGQYLP